MTQFIIFVEKYIWIVFLLIFDILGIWEITNLYMYLYIWLDTAWIVWKLEIPMKFKINGGMWEEKTEDVLLIRFVCL